MARKRSRPWYVGCRWEVLSKLSNIPANWHSTIKGGANAGWTPVYCSKTKAQAKTDAAEWARKTGQPVKVVAGPGHKSRRGF